MFIKNPGLLIFTLNSLAQIYLLGEEKLQGKVILTFLKLLKGIDLVQVANAKNTQDTECKSIFLRVPKGYTDFISNQPKVNNNQNLFNSSDVSKILEHFLSGYLKTLTKSIFDLLNDEKAPWKLKIVFLIFGIILSYMLDPKSEEFKELTSLYIKLLDGQHYFLRQFALASLPTLLRLQLNSRFPPNFRVISRSEEDFKSMKKTLEEVIQTHFILKDDIESQQINDPSLGFYDRYIKIKINPIIDYDELKNEAFVNPSLLTNEFMDKLLNKLVNDLSIKEENSQQSNALIVSNADLATNMQLLMNTVFSKGY